MLDDAPSRVPRRSRRTDHRLPRAGFCTALDPALGPGDVVLATERHGPGEAVAGDAPAILAGALRRAGLRVAVGPIASGAGGTCTAPAPGHRPARPGVLAIDLEAGAPDPAHGGVPRVMPRVVVDALSSRDRWSGATAAGLAARRSLRQATAVLQEWAAAIAPREVVLAGPRAFCAGVVRAVEIVERALEARGAPVYVRKQIVHNAHVVQSLEARGAVFVDEVDEVPAGQTVIFSAHGVSPAVRARAVARDLDIIDATCPLVAKVHAEARRFARAQFDIVLVGHEGHEEVEGTSGEAPARVHVIAAADEVADLDVADPTRVAYLTQTTLAVDETKEVTAAVRERFPAAVGPPSSDICYATQNRQDAVRALAAECDLILVVGAANSSNSRRLVEVGQRAGVHSLLVGDASEVPPSTLIGRRRIGITAGASAPETLVQGVVAALDGIGGVTVREHAVATENVHFKLPPEVRPRS